MSGDKKKTKTPPKAEKARKEKTWKFDVIQLRDHQQITLAYEQLVQRELKSLQKTMLSGRADPAAREKAAREFQRLTDLLAKQQEFVEAVEEQHPELAMQLSDKRKGDE